MKKKLLAFLTAACMLLSVLSMGLWANATDGSDSGGSTATTVTDNGSAGAGSDLGNSPANNGYVADLGDTPTNNGNGPVEYGNDPASGNGASENDGDPSDADPNGQAGSDDGAGSDDDTDPTVGSDNVPVPPITTTTTVEKAWITRAGLPAYASGFYTVLVTGSDNDRPGSDVLTQDDSYTVDTQLAEEQVSSVAQVDIITVAEPPYLAGISVSEEAMGQESVYTLSPTDGDRAVDYSSLEPSSLVKTSAFNGLYVTSVVKTGNAAFENDLQTAKDNVILAVRSFERDHPEVFWLTSQIKLRIVTANVTRSGKRVQEAFFFYVLADDSGFTVRDAAYASPGAIQAGIQKRDQAIKTILASVPKSGANEQVRALNKWLTEHNEYNTSADLNAIGVAPHSCLSALTGRIGTAGPVCDGYSKAFKVLCDQLQIPCVLEMGTARATPSGTVGLHMWNSVKMPDGKWYGADITWDDPVVAGKTGAVSGSENEDYLLVGSSTVIRGMRFDASHRADASGAYAKGPVLSAAAYNAEPDSALPFTDVPEGSYYAEAVRWALDNGVTAGTSATTFSPSATCTRGQVVTFLWRAKGEPAPKTTANPFKDVKSGDYFCKAVQWAVEEGITAGTSATTFSPNGTCTRAHIVTFLWRCLGESGKTGQGKWYDDAVNWANGAGLLSGTAQAFSPGANCPRADVVTYLYRALNK